MRSTIVALVGNPNCGKTTLFNALTHGHQRVGNWAGVTVELKRGKFDLNLLENSQDFNCEIVDLPGCYSLETASCTSTLDEHLVYDYLVSNNADIILNVVDATHLERHLYFTLQLLEQGLPVVVALSMMDEAKKKEIHINVEQLEEQLGCPVVSIDPLLNLNSCLEKLKKVLMDFSKNVLVQNKKETEASLELNLNVSAAKKRYDKIAHILSRVGYHKNNKSNQKSLTDYLDMIVLNRVLGIPIFLCAMYLMFVFSIHMGGLFQDFFDISSRTLFVEGVGHWLKQIETPSWIISLVQGIGQGINTTVTFIPVIGGLFLCLSFLEASGYMARAAFVMDRVMQLCGLPGKAFVPMIVGFGCNVPAVMGARTLDNQRERILTIMMTPFMSCGARLAIYAIFVAAFFKEEGQNIIFALYLIGILMAILTGFLLRKLILVGKSSPLVMELPLYRWPSIKNIGQIAGHRLKRFILKAGALIVPLCALMGLMGSFKTDPSYVATLGRTITPLFAPMGIKEDNWPATVGLLTGVLAKEVVVGTLNVLYLQEKERIDVLGAFSLSDGLKKALFSIPDNAVHLIEAFKSPLYHTLSDETMQAGAFDSMVERFGGTIAAFSYLLFVLLYFPCVSVVAVIAKELNKTWALGSVVWATGVAYFVSVLFYQGATFREHPFYSFIWIISLVGIAVVGCFVIKRVLQMKRYQRAKMFPTPIVVRHCERSEAI